MNSTGIWDKTRALFLAALMITSVFAGTITLSGAAVAQTDDTLLVDGDSNEGGFNTIQAAIDAASDNDTIVVQEFTNGIYGTFNPSSVSNLTIRSASGVTPTLEADGTGLLGGGDRGLEIRGFQINLLNGADIYLKTDNLVFADNNIRVSGSSNYGIRVGDSNGVTITDNTWNIGAASTAVQGVLLVDNTNAEVSDNTFTGDTTGSGLVIPIQVANNPGDSTNISITGNSISGADFGILLDESSSQIQQVTIRDNTFGSDIGTGVAADDFTGDQSTDGFLINGEESDEAILVSLYENNADLTNVSVVSESRTDEPGSPIITNAEPLDTDNDGDIDTVNVTFDEPVRDDSLAASDFQIGGQTFDSVSTVADGDAGAYDNKAQLTLDEGNEFDGTSLGNDSFGLQVSGESSTTDLAGNQVETVDIVGPSIQSAVAFNNKEDGGNEVVDDGTNGIDITSGGTTGNAPDAADQLVEVTFDEVVEDAGSGLEASDFRVTLSDETVVTPSGAHDVASGDGQVLLVLEDSDVDNVKQIAEVSVSNAGFADDNGNTVAVSDNQDIEVSTTASSALAEGGSTDGSDPRQVFAGESVAFVTNGVNDDFEINTDAGEFVFSGSTGTNSIVFSFDTTDRNNSAVFTFSGSDISGTQAVGIRSLGLNGQADETSLTDEEALTGTVDANSGGREVTVELFEADADFEDDDPVDSTTVSLDGSGDASFDFGAQSTGNFTVQVTDVSSGVTDTTDDIEVTQAADGEAEFVESTITEQRGDIIEFTVDLQNTANAGVKIGSASAGFLINGTVADGNDDDQATIRINTVNYRISVDGDLSNGLSLEETPDNVLAAANYNLRALEGSTTPDNADDPGNVATGSLVIEERTTSNFRTHVAPGAQFGSFDLNDDDTVDVEDVQAGIEDGVITQRNQIAAGDVLIHQVVASGLDGFINPDTIDAGSDVTDAFFNNVTLNADNPSANGAEIILNVEQDSANANQDAQQLTLDSSNTQVIAGDDQYFLLTDTEQLSNLQTGEQIEATVFLNADRDDQGDNTDSTTNVNAVNFEEFFGEAQVSTTASPEEPEVEFTTTNATASGNGTIAGETNIAPGTEVRIVASAESDVTPSFVNSETVVVQSDGGFNVAFDFTENSAGDDYSLEAEDLGSGAPDISVSTTGTLEAGQATPTQTVTETATGETETDTETETEAPDTETETETDTETETEAPDTETETETDTETATEAPDTETETETDTETATEAPDTETETETDTETETEAPDTETETETDTETATEAPDTETETETDTETATEAPDTETETTTGTSTPGFTAVLGVVALLGAALVALRRQN